MGNLHQGHLSLCKRALRENDIVIVSIFINPTQFNEAKDYDAYPQTLEKDLKLLADAGIQYVFIPSAQAMYADEFSFQVVENKVSQEMEGSFRPGHFTGMLTIVLKLLNIISPQKVYFGEKDFQQLLLVKQMVASLFLPIQVIAGETIRDANGLALSSRNSRLRDGDKIVASKLYQLLASTHSLSEIKSTLTELGFAVEYVEEKWQRRLAAVKLNAVRLIDNVSLTV
jgi:pantoate--beta-alanine ligase